MEVSVKYLQRVGLDFPARWANQPALIVEEKKRSLAVILDGGHVRTIKLDPKEVNQMRPVPFNGGDYPVAQYVERIIHASETYPATKATRTLLMRISDAASRVHTQLNPEKKGSRGSVIMILSDELKLEPRKVRKYLRVCGFHAPYESAEELIGPLRTKLDSLRAAGRVP